MTARKRRPKTIEDLFEPTVSEQDFDEFLDQIGDTGSFVEIYRIERTERQQLDVVEFDDIRQDPYGYLRSRFGVGKYSLKFKTADRKYQGNKTLVVGSQLRAPDAPVVQVAPAAPATSAHDEFVKEMLLAMVAAQKPPDLGGMMSGLGAVLTAILAGTKGNGAGDPVAMFTAVTKAAADMKGPNKDEDWLDRIGKVVTIVKTLSPESAPDTGWGVLRDVGKEVVHRLVAAPAEVTTAAPTAPAAPGPGGNGNMPTQADWVKTGLAYLKAKAKMKKDAGLYIDFMFENHEEPQWNAILGAVQQGATFEHLLQFDPEIGQDPELTPWFRTLYDGIHSNIFEQVDSGRETGDTGNPAGNGGTVSPGEPTS